MLSKELGIQFKRPDNQPDYLCGRCVSQEDKREMNSPLLGGVTHGNAPYAGP